MRTAALQVACLTPYIAALVCWGLTACAYHSPVLTQVADMVELRSKSSLNYGIVLIPEGLVEFVPEMGILISELNDLLVDDGVADQQKVAASLSPMSCKVSSDVEQICVMEAVQAMQSPCKLPSTVCLLFTVLLCSQPSQARLHGVQVFGLLPASIRDDLLRERDPHGNVQVGLVWVLGLSK